MSNQSLIDAIERAERAAGRLERAAADLSSSRGREEKLRSTVREVVAELDSLIAAGGR